MISMFQTWRWKLRAARQACDLGRLDEAVERLREDDLQQFAPAQPLRTRLAELLSERCRARVAAADFAGAWSDLELIEWLAGESVETAELSRRLMGEELESLNRQLAADQFAAARLVLARLQTRRRPPDELQVWHDLARRCETARRLLEQGRFAEAETAWREAASVTAASGLTERCESGAETARRGREIAERMQAAAERDDWATVRSAVDELLAIAPHCEQAIGLRERARAPRRAANCSSGSDGGREAGLAAGRLVERRVRVDATAEWRPSSTRPIGEASRKAGAPGGRFLLWVDGVGGYLVCLGEEVSIGQAAPQAEVDVPVFGDLSRRHAAIRRAGEHYLVEPAGTTSVRQRTIAGSTLLRDGDDLTLGEQLRLRFRQPHVLSASARLEWLSRHRNQPSTDGVLLMAESLVLGPDGQNHVVCRGWTHDLVLYRRDGRLYCRSAAPLEVDGRPCTGEAVLETRSRITGPNFAVSLEPG